MLYQIACRQFAEDIVSFFASAAWTDDFSTQGQYSYSLTVQNDRETFAWEGTAWPRGNPRRTLISNTKDSIRHSREV
jgi:hypothetical protein